MKKRYLSVAIVLSLVASISMTSCLGRFALANKVLAWNKQVGNKFVNELVFFGLWIVPVYELSFLADIVVFNSIEFWSGVNPVVAQTKVIDGKDARYLVACDNTGYTITNLSDNSEIKFNFDKDNNSWSIEENGQEHLLFTYVDENHINMVTPDGSFRNIELSDQGVWAYQQSAAAQLTAMK